MPFYFNDWAWVALDTRSYCLKYPFTCSIRFHRFFATWTHQCDIFFLSLCDCDYYFKKFLKMKSIYGLKLVLGSLFLECFFFRVCLSIDYIPAIFRSRILRQSASAFRIGQFSIFVEKLRKKRYSFSVTDIRRAIFNYFFTTIFVLYFDLLLFWF